MTRTMLLGVLAAVNVALGVAAQWMLLVKLGLGPDLDAYFAGLAIPSFVLATLSGSLSLVLVPMLAERSLRVAELRAIAWRLIARFGTIFFVLAAVLAVTAQFWLPLMVPGFDPARRGQAVALVRIHLLVMALYGIGDVAGNTLQAANRLIYLEVVQFFAGVLNVAGYAWFVPHHGVLGAAWVRVAAGSLSLVLLLSSLGLPRRASVDFDPGVMWRRLRPLLWGSVYYRTSPLVDRFLASFTPAGGLALVSLATQAYGAVATIVHKSLIAPAITHIARHVAEGRIQSFRQVTSKRRILLAVLGLLAVVALVVMGEPVLALLVGHGGVTQENVRDLWLLLVAMTAALFPGFLGQMNAAILYASGETTTHARIGAVGYTLGVLARLGGLLAFGTFGIGLGISVQWLAATALLHLAVARTRWVVEDRRTRA